MRYQSKVELRIGQRLFASLKLETVPFTLPFTAIQTGHYQTKNLDLSHQTDIFSEPFSPNK